MLIFLVLFIDRMVANCLIELYLLYDYTIKLWKKQSDFPYINHFALLNIFFHKQTVDKCIRRIK